MPQPEGAPAPPPPLISIIVPHYNDLAHLAQCLEHLRHQSWPAERREIIIADNNSDGGVAAVEAIAGDARVVAAREQGAGPARNAAVAAARGGILAFIDSDCFAAETWLAEGLAALERFDYVGGEVRICVPDPRRPTPAEAYEIVFAFDFRKYIEQDRFSGTGNLFVPKGVFERVGDFRNGVSEDIDWCRRANALGYRLGYAERAVVEHPARREWHELTRRWNRVIAEMFRLRREEPHWVRGWLVYTALVALSPLPHALRILRHERLPGARNKIFGLLALFGLREYRAFRMLRCFWQCRATNLSRPASIRTVE
ncbi:MAG TPA: glycosyltransferase [Stellaceae bacterium]|nr:glycosyltransferase [Stellaceae bacterium]